ncbi:MAG TPA: hypothetical protein VM433_06640 [Mycobacteriales bacterium]|nr:hypothetical protein [Mycobacteriales bacterium]
MDAQVGLLPAELPGSTPVPPAPRSRKGGPRPLPQRQDAFAHLDLDALRSYRRALGEEEGRVSYWRRILQARLDVLRARLDGGTARDVDTDALRPVLTDARVGAGRQALLEVVPVDGIPPLPQIELLWERRVDPADTTAARQLEVDLADAERQLSDYRAALHRQIADATGDLIARYREQPSLCLTALPLPLERRLTAAG